MAGSRLHRVANLFSRTTGMLRTGAMKYEDRPIWYDVYRVFPPKYEPRYNRDVDENLEVPAIFYDEDLVRVQFFEKYGLNPSGVVRNLKTVGEEDDCQRFIDSYNELKKSHPDWTQSKIFEATCANYTGRRRSGRDEMEVEESVPESSSVDTVRRRGRVKLVTSETLLSMFKEAQADDSKKS